MVKFCISKSSLFLAHGYMLHFHILYNIVQHNESVFLRFLQVCRLAYEIMQTLHPDASSYFKSLDDIYYFGGQHGHTQVARAAHSARTPDEIELLPGDYIGIAGNHWDGYSLGRNRRTGAQGLYPSYKALEYIQTAVFPAYRDHRNTSLGIL